MHSWRAQSILLFTALASAAPVVPLSGQTPSFEVSSIKLHSSSGINERSGIDENPSAVRVENLPLKALIETAYGIRDDQLSGPGWLATVRYDVVAKPPAGVTQSQLRPMLQSLLAERFRLVAHHESKDMRVYELVVVKSGSKLQESTGPRTFFTSRPALIAGTRVSMRELAAALSSLLGRQVIERTGLSGVYDVKVQWTPDSAAGDVGVSLFTAVQEQLGLKLESSRSAVDVLVIDHIERPTLD